jgi:hypothetical protein
VIDPTRLAPLDLIEYHHKPGTHALILDDSAMAATMDVFDECGCYGNGYGWEGVARSAVRAHAPEISDRVDYDPEAGMFVARSTDRAALERLGMLLRTALHDRTFLADLIRGGDPDWFD